MCGYLKDYIKNTEVSVSWKKLNSKNKDHLGPILWIAWNKLLHLKQITLQTTDILIEVDCSSGQFKSAKLKYKEYIINAPIFSQHCKNAPNF